MTIGGFFEFPQLNCKKNTESALYYLTNVYKNSNCCFLNDGRQAIKSILLNNIKKTTMCYLPAYLCCSVLQPFLELKLKISFYHLTHPLQPIIAQDIENSLLYLIDYFGTESLSGQAIDKFLKQDNIIILDITHSIFNQNRFKIKHKNFYLIAGLRKVFPIPDGGIVYYANPKFKIQRYVPENCRVMLEAMLLKNFYFKTQKKTAQKNLNNVRNRFMTLCKNYEKRKDSKHVRLKKICLVSLYILQNLKFSTIIQKRTKNLNFIYKNLTDKKLFLFDKCDIKSAFALPIVFKNEQKRNKIKNILIKKNIYPPIHWRLPAAIPKHYQYEHNLSKRILSIPIDQRYDPKTLSKITDIL